MSPSFAESVVEDAALAWLRTLGYEVLHGPAIAVDGVTPARSDPAYRDVILVGRLRAALARLNPDLPAEAREDALRRLARADGPTLLDRNRALHRMITDGVTVEYRRPDGSIAGVQARVVDFEAPGNNDWLAVNQFTVSDGQHTRRPDVVLFLNGLPVAVIELKNAANEDATVWTAVSQLRTYQAQIPVSLRHQHRPGGLRRRPGAHRCSGRGGGSGSSPGAPSRASKTRRQARPSSRSSSRASSSGPGS